MKLLTCLLFVFSAITTHAQVKFGVQAGLGLSDIVALNRSSNSGITYVDDFYEVKPSFTLGATMLLPIAGRFELVSLLQYTNKGTRTPNRSTQDSFLDLQYVSIPLLARYNINRFWHLEVGPELAYLFRASVRKVSNDEAKYYNRWDIGVTAGGGVYLTERLSVGARYFIGMLHIFNDEKIPNSPPSNSGSSFQNRYAQLYASYTFN